VKLALVNPNTSAEITHSMALVAAEAAGQGVEVIGHTAPFGATLITEPASLAVAERAVVAMAPVLAEADAVIVAAFGDPGLVALRAALARPVTGLAEAGMAEAGRGGRRFAVVTTTPGLRERISMTATAQGHRRFAGTWTTSGDPAALTADPPALEAALAAAVEEAVRQGGAEAIVIGGGPLAVAARALRATAPVLLVEPVPAAVRLSLARAREDIRA
jgi:Asp/Glu/hydantoin racemase